MESDDAVWNRKGMERQVWTVNDKKVVEALREIFAKCGVGIVGEPIKFRSAVFDLLDEWHYKDERLVFRIAIESNALLPFVSDASITGDMAAQMINQLKKNHMTEKDAEFVVQCIIAACGGEPDMVIDHKNQQEEEQKPKEDTQNTIIYESPCSFKFKGELRAKGTVRLYQDKLKCVSKNGRKEVDVQYQEVLDCKWTYFWWSVMVGIKLALMIVCLLCLNYYHDGIQIISDDVGVLMGAIGAPILVLLSIMSGFPICITRHNRKKLYLITGKMKSQQQLKQEITKCISRVNGTRF